MAFDYEEIKGLLTYTYLLTAVRKHCAEFVVARFSANRLQ